MTDHIKIPDVAPLLRYVANGTQTSFIYDFPIFASEDLAVYFNGARQYSGYDISDVGQTAGGLVTFDEPPVTNIIITLERRLPFERMTDFIEGGDFSAQAINTELDYMTASLQQLQRDHSPMLRYSDHETPGNVDLPARGARANKALGFDGNGDPIALSLDGASVGSEYSASGIGAVSRTSNDKLAENRFS